MLWNYNNEGGKVDPSNWGSLTPDYRLCASGSYQSPVSIPHVGNSPFFHAMKFNYSVASGYIIVNTGRSLELHHPPGNTISVRDHQYELKKITLHSPSEHTIGGARYSLELQLHHADDFGNLASVAIMFKTVEQISQGFYGRFTTKHFWNGQLPKKNSTMAGGFLDLSGYLPQTKDENHYYVYQGSKTVPPCTEGVQWFVLKQVHEVTVAEVNRVIQVNGENSRPVQPSLGRRFKFF
jgi:carbonic anhydrase